MSGKISQIKLQLPKNKISIKNLCKKNNWNYEEIIEKTGIKNVYHSTNNESALNLAVKAGAKITKNNKNIDVLIYEMYTVAMYGRIVNVIVAFIYYY